MGIAEFIGVVIAVTACVPIALTLGGGLVIGKNGYSLSKLQLLLWTAFVAVSYLIYLWRLQTQPGANFEIAMSPNLLVLVGISAGSYVTAKGIRIRQSQNKSNLVFRSERDHWKWRDLISDNSDNLDLSKVQMLVWTVVALSAYVVQAIHGLPQLDFEHPALPNVSEMLVVLMGISQVAYIGRKAVPETQPTPSAAPPQTPAGNTQ